MNHVQNPPSYQAPVTPIAPPGQTNPAMGEAVSFGFSQTNKNFGFFAPVILLFLVLCSVVMVAYYISLAPYMGETAVLSDFGIGYFATIGIFSLIFMVIYYAGYLAVQKASFDILQARKPSWRYLFPSSGTTLKFVGAVFLYFITYLLICAVFIGVVMLLSFLGTILGELLGALMFIVMPILFIGLYGFLIYFLIKTRYLAASVIWRSNGFAAAMKDSWNITKGRFWYVVGFTILLQLVYAAGVLALGIGLLWALPTMVIADAYMYLKLSGINSPLFAQAYSQPQVPFNPNIVASQPAPIPQPTVPMPEQNSQNNQI